VRVLNIHHAFIYSIQQTTASIKQHPLHTHTHTHTTTKGTDSFVYRHLLEMH